jgi:regulatory protein
LNGGGLQSDDRFAETFIRSRASKGYGMYRIRQELQLKGITGQGVERRLGEYDWDRLLGTCYAKKYGASLPASSAEYGARVRFLMQRGFGQIQIQALFRGLRQTDE